MTRADPKVSIILPTYNRAAFIRAAIDSVLSQTFRDFELIVVDDGSTDDTSLHLQAYSDERIVLVRQENGGRSRARNRALDLARGAYVAFIDSDDLYLPSKLALQVAFLDANPGVGMVYTSAICVDENGNDLGVRYAATASGSIYSSVAFFKPVTITLPTVMVRKNVLDQAGRFDERMSRFEDTDMWRRVSKLALISAMDIETCKLRTHAGNALASQDPCAIIAAIAYYRNKILIEDQNISLSTRRRGLAVLQLHYGVAFIKVAGWRAKAIALIALAHRDSPLAFVRWVWTHRAGLAPRAATLLSGGRIRFRYEQ